MVKAILEILLLTLLDLYQTILISMKTNLYLLVLTFIFIQSCTEAPEQVTQITWDEWGVPHIEANNEEDLFYGQGWAQMEMHTNLILEMYGSSRGRGAEYWGTQKLEEDMMIHTLGFPKLAKEWQETQDPRLKKIITAFVRGMNDFVTQNPDLVKEEYQQVLPLTPDDVSMHAMYVIFTRFIGGGELGRIQQWSDMGSNTYAIAPERSASGNAMLVQNPHLPWWREFTFWESQLILKGKRIYGANIVGFPGIAIGFNENLGWSHTDNTLDNADTYELTLADGGYIYDGETKAFETSSVTLKVKQEDGTLAEQNLDLASSVHGPVVKMGEKKALALRMVGYNTPNAFLQWWSMATSENLEQFESALKMAQIPFWNVMYADKDGNIFYVFNGLVPKRSEGDWDFWNSVVPGDSSKYLWKEVHAYEDLPKVKNPAHNWLQNANDPPWTSTIPRSLDPKDFPAYMSPNYMSFRPQRSARMMMEDSSITFDELVDYKHSTRLEFADRILDDLFAAVEASDSDLAKEAQTVLANWDRKADADSKGMLLFFNWARKFGAWNNSNYAEKWNPDSPENTPDGLADPARAVSLLEEAAQELKEGFGTLEAPWGDYYRIQRNGKDLPGNGIDGSLGVFRVAWPDRAEATNMYIGGGDSWVGVIEFGEAVKAKVLLSYGNSSEENSPHNGDQLQYFSDKKLRDAWFYKDKLEGHIKKVVVLGENGFEELVQ